MRCDAVRRGAMRFLETPLDCVETLVRKRAAVPIDQLALQSKIPERNHSYGIFSTDSPESFFGNCPSS